MSLMTSPTTLIPLADMLARLLARGAAVAPARVAVAEALGWVAAETLRAGRPVPAVAQALRRGIAVTASDVVGASPYTPVPLASLPVAVRAGDALPPGCDAVLPADTLQSTGPLHEISQTAYPGEDAILAGGDLGSGAVIVAAGETVTPAAVLALSLAGVAEVAVRRPAIAVEAQDPAVAALSDWLRASLTACGCRIAVEEPAALSVMISRDGGSGGLALNPGRDIRLVEDAGRATLVLPARFDSVVAGFHALVLPMVAALTGRRLRRIARPLTRKLVSQVGVCDIALLRSTEAGYEPLAVGRVALSSLLAADAVAVVDPSSEGAAAGDLFLAIPVHEPFEPQ